MQFRAHISKINIIQAYGSTADKSDDEIEEFYSQLCKITKHSDINILQEDFNAKIGNGEIEECVGPYGLGERNER